MHAQPQQRRYEGNDQYHDKAGEEGGAKNHV
jgi:hypothetical protein